MNALLAWLGSVLAVVKSGADRVLHPSGTPVCITAVGWDYWVVTCVDPAGVFLLERSDWTVSEYPGDFREPQGTGLLEGEPLVCDRGADRLHVGVLGDGVKAVATLDMDADGDADAGGDSVRRGRRVLVGKPLPERIGLVKARPRPWCLWPQIHRGVR